MNLKYQIRQETKEIPIYLGKSIWDIGKLLTNISFDKISIVTDKNVYKFWHKTLNKAFSKYQTKYFVLPAGENTKSLDNFAQLSNKILDWKISKNTLLVAFGGGVVGNIAGLIAATLFRGIKFVHIPTTIMAQADSTTGGKQAVNSKHGKNTIGTFYEPEFIYIDYAFLKTLPRKEISCGIAECIKHGLCQDQELIQVLLKPSQKLQEIIERTIELKLNLIKKIDLKKTMAKYLSMVTQSATQLKFYRKEN